MANQAIALQSRAPQGNILGPALQQGAQMVNMMRQQEAAERQAAATNQQMEIARARAAREAELHPLQVSQTQASIAASTAAADASTIDRADKLLGFYTKRAPAVLTPAAYDLFLKDMDRDDPNVAAQFRASLPVESFNLDSLLRMFTSLNDQFSAKYGTPKREFVNLPKGKIGVAVSGGTGPTGVFELPGFEYDPSSAGASPPPVAQRSSAPPMAFAPAPAPNPITAPAPAPNPITAPMPGPNTNPVGGAPLNRASGNMYEPTSMRAGPPMSNAQPKLADIINEATSSRKISESNLQMIRDVAGPDKDAQLIQLLKAENIRIVPDAQTGMSSAMLRDGDEAPQLQMVQDMSNYRATGRPAVGTMRGADQVRDEARARAQVEREFRERPQEAAAKVYATETARLNAQRSAGPKPLTPVQEAKLRENITKDYNAAQTTLDMMLAPDTGLVKIVDNVRKLSEPQKVRLTGYSRYLPPLSAEDKAARSAFENLDGKVTSMGLSVARLTGSIGSIANQEWNILKNLVANLKLETMGPTELDKQLDLIEAQARRAAQTARDAFENQYFEEFARYGPNRFALKDPEAMRTTPGRLRESELPRVRTDADFNRLKPGTTFIDAKGEKRVKPDKRVQYTPEQMAVVRSIQGGPRGAGGTQTNPTMVMNKAQFDKLPTGTWFIDNFGNYEQKVR
jgi:hypothetical protein